MDVWGEVPQCSGNPGFWSLQIAQSIKDFIYYLIQIVLTSSGEEHGLLHISQSRMLLIVEMLDPAMGVITQACGSMLTSMASLMKHATTIRPKTKVRLKVEMHIIKYNVCLKFGKIQNNFE